VTRGTAESFRETAGRYMGVVAAHNLFVSADLLRLGAPTRHYLRSSIYLQVSTRSERSVDHADRPDDSDSQARARAAAFAPQYPPSSSGFAVTGARSRRWQ